VERFAKVLDYMGGLLRFKDDVSFSDSLRLAWCFNGGRGQCHHHAHGGDSRAAKLKQQGQE
jgi:hypothetical protein